jgi:hypothetical protein
VLGYYMQKKKKKKKKKQLLALPLETDISDAEHVGRLMLPTSKKTRDIYPYCREEAVKKTLISG